jgi:hypothetical protein
MAALNFPANPTNGEVYEFGALSWTWDGTAWNVTTPTDVESRLSDAEAAIAVAQVDIDAINANLSANYYTKTASDARFLNLTGSDSLPTVSPALNDRILIHDTSADTLSQNTVSIVFGPYGRGRRNMFDNGGLMAAQRGVGPVSIGATAGFFTADRWYTNNGNVGAWQQTVVNEVIPGKGLRRALRMVCTTADASLAAGDFCYIYQPIEGYTLWPTVEASGSIKAMSVTVDIKTTTPGRYIAEVLQFTTGGTATRSISIPCDVTLTNTWESLTLSIPADTSANLNLDNATGLGVYFFLAAGSTYQGGTLASSWGNWPRTNNTRLQGQTNLAATVNNNIYLANLQLEVGDPTPFEEEPLDRDLQRCHRYFQRHQAPLGRGVIGVGSTVARIGVPLYVPMRTNPTMSFSGSIGLYDGADAKLLSTIGANLSTNPAVAEFDATANSSWTVTGRACVMYQGVGGYMDFSADL